MTLTESKAQVQTEWPTVEFNFHCFGPGDYAAGSRSQDVYYLDTNPAESRWEAVSDVVTTASTFSWLVERFNEASEEAGTYY